MKLLELLTTIESSQKVKIVTTKKYFVESGYCLELLAQSFYLDFFVTNISISDEYLIISIKGRN